MSAQGIPCRDVGQLRDTLRAMTEIRALPPETRSRLVLSVVHVAEAALRRGGEVVLGYRPPGTAGAPGSGPARLTAWFAPPAVPPHPEELDLPLPAERLGDSAVVWRLPKGSGAPDEDELKAALARIDELTAEQRRLKHELAETNSGVLALYVQLEEQEEEVRRAHGKVLRELEDALRPPPVRVPGLDMGIHYAPADSDAPTGGDLYDWFTLADGTLHITVVDALGHGVKSTRSALNVTHAVRTLALEGHALHSIIARTDEILLPFDRELMATVLLVRIDPATGETEIANGSHPPGLLVRADGTGEFLEIRGRGIGFPMPGSDGTLRTRMDPDDLLILYTDGLTESRRDPSEGELRLLAAARRHRRRPMAEIPGALAADMHTVILHSDDTLALAVRRAPAAEEP
ncbi:MULTISPECIES: PP2C family protein-serine/threonine phosphatase [Streptomyces]|uniref:Translation initiation factor IF-2 n=1 Tax=Streptomyces albus (strain ATCC 21838 / DSM 41398 / FERM P-419 / JCM 4703 / NBRC 107858) TaxID=1081613 RepID=A0A0B5ES90_STRA4|nr:PP2C family protein-serine/threonine phosphatase [Streptomyces sp. SCSIO ZS0520]AJE84534.1 translation initiation factor IF-2 [Streptomyces albus]AOU78844.1 translation initiation factor IF-2 [Streptomyces albus]AYN34580.1 translation initiation factor IF-2 [Streptomyces albus]